MELTVNIDDTFIQKITKDLEEGLKNRPDEYREEITGYWKYYLSKISVGRVGPNKLRVTGASGFYFPGMTYSGHDLINTLYKRFGLMRKIKGSQFDLSIPQSGSHQLGYKISGKWISVDFLRSIHHAQKIVIQSEEAGVLLPDSPRILEIGSGTGIQALVFKLLYNKSTYFLVDFPETLALAQVFLSSVLPRSNFLFFDDWRKNPELLIKNNYDFVFVPNYAISQIPGNSIHLALNTDSMQEMNYKTIHVYFNELRRVLTKPCLFYQCNRDKIMDKILIEVGKYPYNSKDSHLYQGKDEFSRQTIVIKKLFGRFPIPRMLRRSLVRRNTQLPSLTRMSK